MWDKKIKTMYTQIIDTFHPQKYQSTGFEHWMKAIAASNNLDYPVHSGMNEYQRCHPFLMVLLVVIQWSGSSSRSASSGA
jgi:hypothetical protein